MRIVHLLFAVMATLSSTQALAVFKCAGAGGNVTYQETPCAEGGGRRIDAKSSTGQSVAASSLAAGPGKGQSAADYNRIVTAMANGEPAIGMTREQLAHAMGNPHRANTGQYGERHHDQLIYERPGGTIYVYIRDDKVSSIQTSAGYKTPQKNCPTALEIRNAETAAGSITHSDEERRRQQRHVDRMKRCLD